MPAITFCFRSTVHLHRKFNAKKGVRIYSAEEEGLWKAALMQMNAHIRYLRSKVKKNEHNDST